MSEDPTDPATEPTGRIADPGGNGSYDGSGAPAVGEEPRVTAAKLRAHVAKLRHWCRYLLGIPESAGVLPDDSAAELRSTAPAMSEDEALGFFLDQAKDEPVRPDHPAFVRTAGEPTRVEDAITALTAERERLRQAFFRLHDHFHPDLDITEEYLLEQIATNTSGDTISDIIAEFEREAGGLS